LKKKLRGEKTLLRLKGTRPGRRPGPEKKPLEKGGQPKERKPTIREHRGLKLM